MDGGAGVVEDDALVGPADDREAGEVDRRVGRGCERDIGCDMCACSAAPIELDEPVVGLFELLSSSANELK